MNKQVNNFIKNNGINIDLNYNLAYNIELSSNIN